MRRIWRMRSESRKGPSSQSGLQPAGGSYPFVGSRTDANGNCIGEDDQLFARWAGDLAAGESFTVTIPFCDYAGGPGGVGFAANVWRSKGNPNLLLTFTAATGQAFQRSTAWGGRVPWYYEADPRVNGGNPIGIDTIEPGPWTVTLTNVGAKVARGLVYDVIGHMAYPGWQLANCPAGDTRILQTGDPLPMNNPWPEDD
jgi:hypothetical protein